MPWQRDYLETSIKSAQYLAGLTIAQDIWLETGKVLVSFFGADLAAIAERQDAGYRLHHLRVSECFSEPADLAEQLGETINEVFESGFLAERMIPTSPPLSLAFLPITRESKVIAVMLVGHGMSDFLPRELLNVYLAVAGLVGTTASRLASEAELRQHRHNLQQLVDERTAELREVNEHLRHEIAERERAKKALRVERDNLVAIFEAMEDNIYIVNARGDLLYGNNAFKKDFGHFSGRSCFELLCGGSGPCHDCALSEVLGGKTVRREKFFPNTGKTYHLIETPLHKSDETVKLTIFRDITELKRGAAERLEMERRLLHSQKMESLGVLAGGIAHDFNNLLAIILGNLDLATREVQSDSPARNNIQIAVDSCYRAAKLIGQLLDYVGKRQFPLKNVDLNNVVHENAELFRTSVARHIELTITTTGLPGIKADQGQLQQVIMNLIINAAEAIGSDSGVIAVSTGVLMCDDDYLRRSLIDEKPPSGTYVYLEVSDTGCGMNRATRERLFEPSFTTKFLGRGLGMSAVQGIVRAHGGAILLESAPGEGSVFRILFPSLEESATRPLQPVSDEASEEKQPVTAGVASGVILVVDDEEHVRSLCMAIVEFLGYQAVGAADGIEAVHLFGERCDEIALVILDMTMPNMGGVEALRRLRIVRPDIPVIITSGYSEEDIAGNFGGDMPAAFIQKPFKVELLQKAIIHVSTEGGMIKAPVSS